ncbi:MAG TPA: asparagine synthase-related protein [Thermoanaerobaculia bacterium]|nr:asparagine synthase-related protein [Thermoanaerobaculia bacterium]
MFILLAGPRSVERDGLLERIAAELRGGEGAPRLWRDRDRNAGAASLAPNFVAEDAFDVQPLANEERVFVCQARVDNRDELLPQLGLDERAADSSLLAAAYDRWGEDCVHKVVGDFAFAVWHRRDGHVFAAIDHTGMRRLFWARTPNGIAMSGQLRPLLAHPDISNEPDLDALASLFAPGIDRTSTPYRSIRALPGGHRLSWRNGEVRVERWWNPDARPAIWYRDPREYVDEARELFTRAVAAHVRSSRPISTTLSGGLDSGSVTARAARLLTSRITAYTSVPEEGLQPSQRPNWEPDDRAYAQEVVAAYGNIDHRLVSPNGRCMLDVLPSVHERARTPAKAATNLLWADTISTDAAAAGSRVLLVGANGNAAFSWRGAGTVLELVRFGRMRAALTQANAEARVQQRNVARVLASELRGAFRAKFGHTAGASLTVPGLQLIGRALLRQTHANEYAERPGTRRFWRSVITTPKHTWWPESVVQWGIEWRDPMTDRRLTERLMQYPQAAFRIDGRDRGLARAIALGLLPERIRLRRTYGAQVPEAPSLIAAHGARYRHALKMMRNSARCRELFDLDAIGRALNRFATDPNDYYLAVVVDRAIAVGLFLTNLEPNA